MNDVIWYEMWMMSSGMRCEWCQLVWYVNDISWYEMWMMSAGMRCEWYQLIWDMNDHGNNKTDQNTQNITLRTSVKLDIVDINSWRCSLSSIKGKAFCWYLLTDQQLWSTLVRLKGTTDQNYVSELCHTKRDFCDFLRDKSILVITNPVA